jgi:hypothetical protein
MQNGNGESLPKAFAVRLAFVFKALPGCHVYGQFRLLVGKEKHQLITAFVLTTGPTPCLLKL